MAILYEYKLYIIILVVVCVYLFKVFYYSRRSFVPYNDKLILYFCSELSFTKGQWNQFKIPLQEKSPLTVPRRAILTGAISYPLERASLLILSIAAVGPFSIPVIGNYLTSGTLQQDDLILLCAIAFIPPSIYYFTPYSSDVYSNLKNQLIVKKYLHELGWHKYSKNRLQRLYKEVEIDYLLYKKDSDIGALLIIIGSASMLTYSRLINTNSIALLPFFIILFMAMMIPKSLYEGFRTRIILIALNTLLDLISNQDAEEESTENENMGIQGGE